MASFASCLPSFCVSAACLFSVFNILRKMFAGVKFQCDNTVSIVSVDLIRNFKPPLEANKSCQVFWSSNPGESPGNASRNVDKKYKSQCNRSNTKLTPAPSGYFNAKILCTAGNYFLFLCFKRKKTFKVNPSHWAGDFSSLATSRKSRQALRFPNAVFACNFFR